MQDKAAYRGKDILARELSTANLDMAKGKRVIVIGSAKTALDAAGASAEVADSLIMLSRKVSFMGAIASLKGLYRYSWACAEAVNSTNMLFIKYFARVIVE